MTDKPASKYGLPPAPTTEAEAIMLSALQADHVVLEILLALIAHLHDRQQIDKDDISRLLEDRIVVLSKGDPQDLCVATLPSYIDWLKRLGTGKSAPPPKMH